MDELFSKLNAFRCGQSADCWAILGAHPAETGYEFAVWAPDARYVAVIGEWNDWKPVDALSPVGSTGVWSGAVPQAKQDNLYKFYIEMHDGIVRDKADPFAFYAERQPGTASRLTAQPCFQFYDGAWLAHRAAQDLHAGPFRILAVDPLDWHDAQGLPLDWAALAGQLIPRARDGGYTHLCLTGVLDTPDGSGYGREITGFFSPNARCGAPNGLRQLVDACHRSSLGVLLDWTPAFFSPLYYSLGRFNGTPLFETWRNAPNGCYKFNLAAGQVRSFLTSCACFWLQEYHFDGLQFYGLPELLAHAPGEPDPDAPAFLRALNRTIHTSFPGAVTIASDLADAAQYGFDFYWGLHWQGAVRRDFSASDLTPEALAAAIPTDSSVVLPLPRDLSENARCAALWQDFCPGITLRRDAASGVGLVALNEPALWSGGTIELRDAPAPLICVQRRAASERLQLILNPGDLPVSVPADAGQWELIFSTDAVPNDPALSIPVPAHGGCILRRKPEYKTVPGSPALQEDHQ